MAGQHLNQRSKSVSPIEEDEESENKGEGDDLKIGDGGDCDKITAPREGDFVRKLVDPCLPKGDEVKLHYEMGHAVYRNWCPVWVKASGKEMDHRNMKGKERDRLNIRLITVFQEMNWATNGR